MARQLTFDLPVRPARGRAQFFVSPANAMALAQIETWDNWPNRKLFLYGPAGAGKSHLAHVWAEQMGGPTPILSAAALREPDIAALGDTLGAAANDAAPGHAPGLVIEDLDQIAGDPALETRLFHLHNLMQAGRVHLLVTARHSPRDLPIGLADLKSRLMGTTSARIDAPDDALLGAVLQKQFDDRQITVTPALIHYLVTRIDRSFDAARAVVAALDGLALERGAKITPRLAAEWLDNRLNNDR